MIKSQNEMDEIWINVIKKNKLLWKKLYTACCQLYDILEKEKL